MRARMGAGAGPEFEGGEDGATMEGRKCGQKRGGAGAGMEDVGVGGGGSGSEVGMGSGDAYLVAIPLSGIPSSYLANIPLSGDPSLIL